MTPCAVWPVQGPFDRRESQPAPFRISGAVIAVDGRAGAARRGCGPHPRGGAVLLI